MIAAFDSDEGAGRVRRLVSDAFAADYTDSFVVAYRAFPRLLGALTSDSRLIQPVSPVIESARDGRISQQAGMKLPGPDGRGSRSEPLTKREQGASNFWPSDSRTLRLVSELYRQSTVKVHVRHILEN